MFAQLVHLLSQVQVNWFWQVKEKLARIAFDTKCVSLGKAFSGTIRVFLVSMVS